MRQTPSAAFLAAAFLCLSPTVRAAPPPSSQPKAAAQTSASSASGASQSAKAAKDSQASGTAQASSSADAGSPAPRDPIALLQGLLQEDGLWAEYAPLQQDGRPDLAQVIRLSALKDASEGDAFWLEMWMDKFGESAVRLRFEKDHTVSRYEFKRGDQFYGDAITSQEADGGAKAASPAAKSPFSRAGKSLTEYTVAEGAGEKTYKTIAGTYACKDYTVTTSQGALTACVSPGGNGPTAGGEAAATSAGRDSVARVISFTLPQGMSYQLVSHGRNARSVFSGGEGMEPTSITALTQSLSTLSEEINAQSATTPAADGDGGADAGMAKDGGGK